MISILFVDDEVNILEGIRNSLRKRLCDWSVAFATSGPEALETLSKSKFDIIVSDMRMPGMDGADLLARVQERYPYMTRFILTGQADREAILRAIPVTHQFMYKPCSPTDLIALLDRTCNLHERIQNEVIRRLVSSAKCVPSAPKTAAKIAEIRAQGENTLSNVAALIERDPGLSARVLQVSNSAVMGRSKEVTSIPDAVSFIGLECAESLAMANEVFNGGPGTQPLAKLLESTCEKAFQGATFVSKFLKGHPEKGLAMTATLLRDIGLIVSASSNPSIYKLATDPNMTSESLIDVERTCLGVTHAEIGGHLLALWGTPMTIVEAVSCHHDVEEATINPFVMAAVHVADILVENYGVPTADIRGKINWEFASLHQLESDIEEWLDLDLQYVQQAA